MQYVDPIQVAVVFTAEGGIKLQKGAEDLDRLAARLQNMSARAGSGSQVLRTIEADINRFGQSLRSKAVPALELFNKVFTETYGLMRRMAAIGFAEVIGKFALMGGAVTKLGRDFLSVNEKFAGFEIVIKSVYQNLGMARAMRDELAKITVSSPLPFKDLANVGRAFATIPGLSGQLVRQYMSPGGFEQSGALQKMVKVVEQLTTFRPDQPTDSAIFAIREAVTGQIRSLQRRFEFSPSLLTSASGKSLDYLKQSPSAMLDALSKALDNIISPDAVRLMAKQPTKLFQNFLEQIHDIPLLKVGRLGEDSGHSFYDRFLDFFYNALQDSAKFTDAKNPAFKAMIERISNALNSMFDTLLDDEGGLVDRLMHVAGLGKQDLPGLSFIERFFEGVTRLIEGAASNLPGLIIKVEQVADRLFPVLKTIFDAISKVVEWFMALAKVSPGAAAGLAAGAVFAPSIVQGLTSAGAGRLISIAQSSRAAVVQGALSPNMLLPSREQAVERMARIGLSPSYNTTTGAFEGMVDSAGNVTRVTAAQARNAGFQPAGFPGTPGASIRAIFGQNNRVALPETYAGTYDTVKGNLRNAGFGGMKSSIAGGFAGAARMVGFGEGVAGGAAGFGLFAAGIGEMAAGMLAVAGVMYLLEKATHLVIKLWEDWTKGKRVEAMAASGINATTLSSTQAEAIREGMFQKNYRAAGKFMPKQLTIKGDLIGGKFQETMMSEDAFMSARMDALDDIEEAYKKSESGEFGLVTKSTGEVISDIEATNEFIHKTNAWLTRNWDQYAEIHAFAEKHNVFFGEDISSRTRETLNFLANKGLNLTKASGIIETTKVLSDFALGLAEIKDPEGKAQEQEKTQQMIERYNEKANPMQNLDRVMKAEGEDTQKVLTIVKKGWATLSEAALKGAEANVEKTFDDILDQLDKITFGTAYRGVFENLKKERPKVLDGVQQAFKALDESAQNAVDSQLKSNVSSIGATFVDLFGNIADMSDKAIRNYADNLQHSVGTLVSRAWEFGETDTQKDLMGMTDILGKIKTVRKERLYRTPQETADINLEQAKNVEAFVALVVKLAPSLEGMLKMQHLYTESMEEIVKRTEMIVNIQNRQEVQGLLQHIPVSGGGASSTAVRRMQQATLLRLNAGRSGAGYNELSDMSGILDMDPSGNRGPEVQLAQSKLLSKLNMSLGEIEEKRAAKIRSDLGGLTPEMEKNAKAAEEMALKYYEAANGMDHLAESIEGKGGNAIQSFTKGMMQTFSEWKAQIANFTEIGKKFADDFASGMGTAFSEIVLGAKNAKEAFRDFGMSFMKMATEMLMQKAVRMLLGAVLGGIGGGASIYAGDATGALVRTGGAYVGGTVDNSGAADGGLIAGSPSHSDNMYIHAASGEYVIPTRVVQKYGSQHFDKYLNGQADRNFTSKVSFASGGMVGGGFTGSNSGSPGSQANVSVNVVVNNEKGTVTTQADAEMQSQFLAQGFQRAIQEELLRQQRQGGLFRKK